MSKYWIFLLAAASLAIVRIECMQPNPFEATTINFRTQLKQNIMKKINLAKAMNMPQTKQYFLIQNSESNVFANPKLKGEKQIIGNGRIVVPKQDTKKKFDLQALKLLKITDIIKAMQAGNSEFVLSQMQGVDQSQLILEQKSYWLRSIYQKVQSAVMIKSAYQSQLKEKLKVIKNAAENKMNEQIKKKRQLQFVKMQRQKNKDTFVSFSKQVQKFINQAQTLQKNVKKKQQQVQILRNRQQNAYKTINNSKFGIKQSQQQLKILQIKQSTLLSQLQYILQKRSKIEPYMTNLSQNIKTMQNTILKNQAQIKKLQQQIKKRREIGIILKQNLLALQITIQTQNKQITEVQRIKSQILIKLPQLKKNAEIEAKIANSVEFKQSSRILLKLKSIIKNLQTAIDVLHYKCNYVKEVTPFGNQLRNLVMDLDIAMDETVISYEFPLKEYEDYLANLYQIRHLDNSEEFKIKMTPISILDSIWSYAFGFPYTPDSFVNATSFQFPEDFQCLYPQQLGTWVGRITKIEPRLIQIQDQNSQKWNLHLSACSRIEAIRFRPIIGGGLLTRGLQRNNNNIQVYRSTCF